MPGMLVLRNDGFNTSANPIVTITGLGSLLMAPFRFARVQYCGDHRRHLHRQASSRRTLQALDRRDCRRRLLHPRRVFGVTLAALFMAFPATFITTLAGLALLGTIGGSLAGAMTDASSREASLITFLAAAANITLFGIGGAFWGLLIGLVAYVVLNGRLPRRELAARENAAN